MDEAIDRGVDGIITDYPDRLRAVAAANGHAPAARHRGAVRRAGPPRRQVRPAREHARRVPYALDAGVDTLELDTGVTQDGVADRAARPPHQRHALLRHRAGHGRRPRVPLRRRPRPRPHAARRSRRSTAGTTDPGFPQQVAQRRASASRRCRRCSTSSRARGDRARASTSRRRSARWSTDTAPYDEFTTKLVRAIERAGSNSRATIQSLRLAHDHPRRAARPEIDTVALVWQFAGPTATPSTTSARSRP